LKITTGTFTGPEGVSTPADRYRKPPLTSKRMEANRTAKLQRTSPAMAPVGGLILTYLLIYKLAGQEIMVQHGPLMMAGILLLLAGLMMFSTGLLGEVLMRTYFESQGRRIYAVREIRSHRKPPVKDAGRRQ
jgi:hypothetical protein